MGKRYKVPAGGLSGVPYRVDIYDNDFGGNVTTLQADNQFLLFDKGQRDDRASEPFWPTELRIFIRDDADLTPLFGGGKRKYPVEVYRTDTSTRVFKGFLQSDYFSDAPYSHGPPLVELRASEGVATLKDDTLDEIYSASDTFVPISDAIPSILSTLYSMDVEMSADWFPDAAFMASDTCPHRYVGFNVNNYREDRPEGDWQSQFDVLADLLSDNSLVLRQVRRPGGARWLCRQRSGLNQNGTIRTWRFDSNGDLRSGQPVDRTKALDLNDESWELDHTRTFERQWGCHAVTHDHAPVEFSADNGDFESGASSWQMSSFPVGLVNIANHDDIKDDTGQLTPGATANNQRALWIEQNRFDVSNSNFYGIATQQVGRFGRTAGDSYIHVGGQVFTEDGVTDAAGNTYILESEGGAVQIKLDADDGTTYYAKTEWTGLRDDVLRGTTEIPVNALNWPIPEGARLPVVPDTGSGADDIETYVTLVEPAEVGDTSVKAEVKKRLDSSWHIGHLKMVTSSDYVALPFWVSEGVYTSFDLYAPMVDSNANGTAGDVTVSLGIVNWSPNRTDIIDNLDVAYDNIDVGLSSASGSIAEETTTEACVPGFGKDVERTVRTSQGPSSSNLSRFKGEIVDSVSVVQESAVPQSNEPVGMYFKPDGSKLYVVDKGSLNVEEYDLSSAWAPSSATHVNSFDISSEDSNPQGVHFKDDGSKMYVIGDGNGNVYEYNLSTNWDTSTASLNNTADVGSNVTYTDIRFKPDGSKMFGLATEAVYQWTLSTAWDTSTKTFNEIGRSFAAQEGSCGGIAFGDSGKKIYVVGSDNSNIYQYDLDTAWDIESASWAQQRGYDVASTPSAVSAKGDGSSIFTLASGQQSITKYDVDVAWEINPAFFPASWDRNPTGLSGSATVNEAKASGSTEIDIDVPSSTELDWEEGQTITFTGHDAAYRLKNSVSSAEGSADVVNVKLKDELQSGIFGDEEVFENRYRLLELYGRERLRRMRGQNEILEINLLLRNGLTLSGDEVVKLDGVRYTIQAVGHEPVAGVARLTLMELEDYGISGIDYTTTQNTAEDGGGGGTTVSSTSSSGGGSEVPLEDQGGLKYNDDDELAVEPSDIAGSGLVDDGSDNLAIDPSSVAGDGIKEDGDNFAVTNNVARTHVDETFDKDVTVKGGAFSDTFESENYSGGWSGSGVTNTTTGHNGRPDFMEATHLSVRGTARFREFEVQQIRFNRGPFAVTPGGGKLADVDNSTHAINTTGIYDAADMVAQEWRFEDSNDGETEHGLSEGDRLLAQRFNPDTQQVVGQIRAIVESVTDANGNRTPHTVRVNVEDSTYGAPPTGEQEEPWELIVAASSDAGRDSMLYLDPYGPYMDVLDNLSDFGDWDNRSPTVRVGNISGAHNSISTQTHGLYGETVRLTDDILVGSLDRSGQYLEYDSSGNLNVVANTFDLNTTNLRIQSEGPIQGSARISMQDSSIGYDPVIVDADKSSFATLNKTFDHGDSTTHTPSGVEHSISWEELFGPNFSESRPLRVDGNISASGTAPSSTVKRVTPFLTFYATKTVNGSTERGRALSSVELPTIYAFVDTNGSWSESETFDVIAPNLSEGEAIVEVLFASGDGVEITSSSIGPLTYRQYQSQTVISRDGVYVKQAPGVVSSIGVTGEGGSTGGGGGGGAVNSVFGRTGDVQATSGDYSHSQLAGVSSDDHHTRPSAGDGLTDSSDTFAVDATVARTDVAESFGDDVTITGDLTVEGNRIIEDTTVVETQDNLIWLNAGATGQGISRPLAGHEVDRGVYTPYVFAFFENNDRFQIGEYWLTLDHDGGTPFTLHERVVGQSSGAEGYVYEESTGTIQVKSRTGSFDAANGETITGQSSNASASLTGKTLHDNTQAVATREDSPTDDAIAHWDAGSKKWVTSGDLTWDGNALGVDTISGSFDLQLTAPESVGVYINKDGSSNKAFKIFSGYDPVGGSFAGGQTLLSAAANGVGVFESNPSVPLDVSGGIRSQNPGTSPTGSEASISSPFGDLGVSFKVGDGNGNVAQRWDIRMRSGAVDLLYDNDNAHKVLHYNQSAKRLEVQPNTSGGTFGLRFRSNVNAGSDYGYIRWYDDNDTYSQGTGTEAGALVIGAENDDAGGGIGDNVVLKAQGHVHLDTPNGDTLLRNGDLRSNAYTSGWGGSDNFYPRSGRAEVDSLSVRDTLIARELEIRKITASKGPHIFGVGGGKIDSIQPDGNGNQEVTFKVDHGFDNSTSYPGNDYVLAQEYSPGAGTVIERFDARVEEVVDSKTAILNFSGYGNNTNIPSVGDDLVQVASSNSNRDSMLFVDPFGPHLDVLDGISNFSQWNSRSPKVRLGHLDGAYGTSSGVFGFGAGDSTTSGDYFVATPNKVKVDGTIIAQDGKIADALTVGDHIFLMSASGNPNTADDEIRITNDETKSDNNDYLRLYRNSNGLGYWGIEARTGDNDVFHLGYKNGSSSHQIAGWNFTSYHLARSFDPDSDGSNEIIVEQGELRSIETNGRYGFGIEDKPSGRRIRMLTIPGSGDMHISAYESNSNEVVIGKDYRGEFNGIGMRLRSNGNDVFQTGESGTTFVDHLEVRSNASIYGQMYVGDKKLHRIRATGTSFANNASGDGQIKINGNTVLKTSSRGVTMVVYDQNMNKRHEDSYDVYGSSSAAQRLKDDVKGNNNLNDGAAINRTDLCIVVSYDATRARSAYKDAVDHIGGSGKKIQQEWQAAEDAGYNGNRIATAIIGQPTGRPSSGIMIAHGAHRERRAYAQSQFTGDMLFGPNAADAVIDGNLLVDGTLTAQKIAASTITTNELASINGTLTVNSGDMRNSGGDWRLYNGGIEILNGFSNAISFVDNFGDSMSAAIESTASGRIQFTTDYASVRAQTPSNSDALASLHVRDSNSGTTATSVRADETQIELTAIGRDIVMDTTRTNSTNGDVIFNGSVVHGSDRRLKEDVTTVADPLDVLREIRGRHYRMHGDWEYGLVAQEVYAAGAEDAVRRGGEDELWYLDYKAMHAFTVESIRTLDDRTLGHASLLDDHDGQLSDHEQRIAELEEENEKLRREVEALK